MFKEKLMRYVVSPFFIGGIIVLVVLASFYLGFRSGGAYHRELSNAEGLYNKELQKPEDVDFYPFWRVWNLLNEKFVNTGTSTVSSSQEKVWGSIQGLTHALEDPYTVFLPPKDNEIFESDIKGNFEGVGMEIGARDGILTVIAPLKGTPAERAGIKSGDMILEINGETTARTSVDEAVLMIRGERGTEVDLTILREGEDEPQKIAITRDVIDIPTIKNEIKDDVFIISLYNFSANSPDLFRKSLQDFLNSRADKLVIDLRGNPGGYLEAAVDISSWFLPSGKVVVSEKYDKEEKIHRSKGYNIFPEGVSLVVLVDGGSASASEIVAGALQQNSVATVVGSKTFGKGSVQELVPVTGDTALKVTVAHWLTPDGSFISGGLNPDEIVENNMETSLDEQLEKAIEIVRSL